MTSKYRKEFCEKGLLTNTTFNECKFNVPIANRRKGLASLEERDPLKHITADFSSEMLILQLKFYMHLLVECLLFMTV